MNVIIVDDEPLLLRSLKRLVSQALPSADISDFTDAIDALEYARENSVDIAFLDIKMRGMTGLELAKELIGIKENTNIIFCTGYSQYALDAFNIYASSYLTKPIDINDVNQALSNLRYPVDEKRVRFFCFGNFEVYCDGKPVSFSLSKTKEMLAYLVDRNGAECRMNETIAVLFGDDNNREYYKKLRKDLVNTFDYLGVLDCLNISRGGLAINKEKVECDYYDYLKGDGLNPPAEYMSQYSFGEYTLANL